MDYGLKNVVQKIHPNETGTSFSSPQRYCSISTVNCGDACDYTEDKVFVPCQPGRSQDLLSDLGCSTAWNLHVMEMQVQSSEQRRQVSCVNLPSLGVLWEERLRKGSVTQGKEKELEKKVTWVGVFIKGRNLEKTTRGPEKYSQIQSFHWAPSKFVWSFCM